MSRLYRTKGEYIQRHAEQYCNGDVEEAKEHDIVKEACKTLKDDKGESIWDITIDTEKSSR